MRCLFAISICFCCQFGFCQIDGSLDLIYGNRSFKNNFYNRTNTLDNYKFGAPVQIAGIGYSGRIEVDGRYGEGYIYGHWYYTQVVPQKVTINDSVKCNLNGYMVSFSILGLGMFKSSSVFHLMLSSGFNTGRLRLHGNEWARQKNPFFSPSLTLQPRFLIGRMVLSLIAEYEFDISSPNWRRTYFATKNKIDLQKFRDTGATVYLCLGFNL